MYNTGNPVPSALLEDLADDGIVLDQLVNKTEGNVTDRTGTVRRSFQQIIMDMGFEPLSGSFQSGATLTQRNQVLQDTSTGVFYSWNGTLPKVVAAASTPATSGGIGATAWVDRTDLTLRSGLLSGALAIRNNTFALRDFVSVLDGFGVVADGSTYDHAAISSAISSQQNLIFPARTYKLNAAISAEIGSNKKLFFMPGARFISDNLSDGIMYFHGVADGFSILGKPDLGYSSTPSTRLAHTIYIRGQSITNLLVDGPKVLNSANMAIAVFCGNDNAVASGSKHITVCNIRSANTLGDTVHIEGADSDVSIFNINSDNSGDDVVAVVNYTGTGSAPTHPTQTKRVQIHNINSKDATTSSISLGGVSDFVVDGVTEHVRSGAACITLKLVHDADYAVGNSDGFIDNIVTDGANKIFAVDTPLTGTAYNTNITFGKLRGKNIVNAAFFASNGYAAAGGRLSDITVENLSASLLNGASPWYVNNTNNIKLGKIVVYGGSGEAFFAGSFGLKWDDIELKNLASSSTNAMTIITSSVDKAGDLTINASGRPTGLQYQSNTKTSHNGVWSVTGASTSNFVLGSNSNVTGYFGESSGITYIGASVAAGTTSDVNFTNPPVSDGAGATMHYMVSVISNEGGRWGYKNPTASKITMVWPDLLSFVYVSYTTRFRVQ